ncbi:MULTISPECIES: hypothetical protein [Pseudoalteromonas]|uniref:Uncharacterized protein n=1 Tax=Pseudoalteromonas fuliginea TaxID=1872678 RepID=A0AB73BGU4_9GAMM|nr:MULTISPECIES: hypothetical protein [Pseudoalteromonas]KAA1160170.1 hypothetical protein EU508_10490 [Pseudoalteromonas fuliginea]KDC49265.1 hypothetical protein DC53_17840 [Pseudoalteromonas fuliginea]KDC53854.1 hypothetical protein DO88_12175 [Pseudoalteromonas sp. S3431]KJZ28873.1 hypothetical protein TW82_04830 [Pseudoalteromonas fuliginea]
MNASNASEQLTTNQAEHIKILLKEIESLVNDNNADEAQPILKTLNTDLKKWCESNNSPNAEQLQSIQITINSILAKANIAKSESSKAIIKYKKSGRAIKAYKAT